jgi:hypothetical protein
MIRMPGPRAHLRGTLRLLTALEAEGGASPGSAALRAWLDRPEALPAAVPPEQNTLKYDGYLTLRPSGPAWGLATADRYEEGRWPLTALCRALGGGYDLGPALLLKQRLPAAAMWTASVGFDQPGAPPRLKLYIQESTWGAGLGSAQALGEALEGLLGLGLPELPGPPGVLTVECLPGGAHRAKVYVGGASTRQLAAGSPEVIQLAQILEDCGVGAGGWSYLTLRLQRQGPPRLALNHIYNHVQVGFSEDGRRLGPCWGEVERLFAQAGRLEGLEALRRRLQAPDLRLVPTALAVEEGGRSVDCYCAAWELSSG